MKPEDVKVDGQYIFYNGSGRTAEVKAIAGGGVLYMFNDGMWDGTSLGEFAKRVKPIRTVPNLGWHLPEWAKGIAFDAFGKWRMYDYVPTFNERWWSGDGNCCVVPPKYAPQIDVAPADSWFTREELEEAIRDVQARHGENPAGV